LIALSSVVALPSLAESFGFSLLDAMSLGKPVVASITGGMPELVADGETGLLVPAADSSALADAICRIILDPDAGRAMGKAGRLRAASFSFERMIKGYEQIYQEIIERRLKRGHVEHPAPSAKREGTLS